ncbi:MAG TPA: alpha-2-macroglobulin family protein [Puia sp.]|nr:alpha-2-macroglobulin family protein [Puia sp.]
MICRTFFVFAFACLLPAFLSAQQNKNSYEKAWAKIDSLINKKGLVQSALDEVNTIYFSAKKEKNEVQVIKALLYKMNLLERKDADAAIRNIAELDKEIALSNQPAKSILQSIEAEIYWSYYQQHRWQLYDRTATINFKKNDISSWGVADFHKKITQLYLASLVQEKLLEQTKLQPFDAIIIKGNVRYLRPTLFDMLSHRALEYFENPDADLIRASDTFELDDPIVFADKNSFANYHFNIADSLSPHFKALLLFQKLLRFHSSDSKPDAILDVDMERLEFANEYAGMEDKEELYTAGLQTITNIYYDIPAAAQAWYLQAQQFVNQATLYNPLQDTANRYAYLKEKKICERVINSQAGNDSCEGKVNCQNLLRRILQKNLSLRAESVNIPGKPFRILVSYKNINRLYLRIIRIEKKDREDLLALNGKNSYWEKLIRLEPLKKFSQSLPDTKDYQPHAVEIKVDALEPGQYALVASEDSLFSLEKNPLCMQSFYISGISYINYGNDYFVLDRETGHPLQGTQVQVYYYYYDPKKNKRVQREGEQFNTDKNGFFHIYPSKTNTYNDYSLEFTRGNDQLLMNENLPYNSGMYEENNDETQMNQNEYEGKNLQTFLFADRSIYRPGQTIYFKGITVTKDFTTRKYKIVPGFRTKVILYDANGEEIDSLGVTTNEFGSYHGNFRLPANRLNGEFKIEDDSVQEGLSFSVEEYKRPKFYIRFDTAQGTYRLNDRIEIKGNVNGYAGNAINGATVQYRVVRQARFPHPWLYPMSGWHVSRDQEITHGEIKTGTDGKFSIAFTAIPDKSIKKEWEPVFEYRISTDITDISGETRSMETVVPIGYKSLNLSIDLPDESHLLIDSVHYLSVQTKNLSGKFEPAKINLTIYRLQSPERLIRQRYWQEPDQFAMSKEEYLKYFPNDEYSNETKKETWEKLDKVLELSDSSFEGKKMKLSGMNLIQGWYLIEASAKDRWGEKVKDRKFVQLYDAQPGSLPPTEYNWISDNSQVCEPGDTARFSIASSANDLFIINKVDKNSIINKEGQKNDYLFFSLNHEKKYIKMPVTMDDRGGFGMYFAFVKNNRFYTSSDLIKVPWSNKELKISYETWRDKTLPGNEEKWKIKITGYQKEKAAAEILSAMYDASLDQFKGQYWGIPNLWTDYFGNNRWYGRNDFLLTQSKEKYPGQDFENNFQKIYDFFIFNRHMTGSIVLRGSKSDMSYGAGPESQLDDVVVTGYAIQRKTDITGAMMNMKAEELKETGQPEKTEQHAPILQTRRNFNETAFFFPDLKTDSSGNVEFFFTMPEAVTQWKWMTLAHTKDLAFGYGEKSVITQKQLMVQPNAPRFLREGDRIEFSAKIVNLTDSEITGQAELQLTDPLTGQQLDSRFSNRIPNQYFTVAAKQSTSINFPIEVPYQFDLPVTYSITARAPLPGNNAQVSDGEESTLPVLTNRTLVTETLPININGNGTMNFKFGNLLHSGESETLTQHALTVEFTSNPAWYVVQSLPYLMEYPYECSEQTFNRFYANALATMITNSAPRIKEVFERWEKEDTATLLSNLQKNEELKSVLLQEAPWVLEANNESRQKKNIALLFDLVRMNGELRSAIEKLKGMQLANGGFAWFAGGADDRYITQYILTGIGHLKKLNALPVSLDKEVNSMATAAINYLDKKIQVDFEDFNQRKIKSSGSAEISEIQILYLYARSFFSKNSIPATTAAAVDHYREQARKSWLQQNKYMQGMIALALFRSGDSKTAHDILNSLKQHASTDEEMGMYWKDAPNGYYWYQAPVETQSLLIEAFEEISGDHKITDNLKAWLLKQKQVQSWTTTKATADACYALLFGRSNWLTAQRQVEIRLDNTIMNNKNEIGETGTGYFKKTIDEASVRPDMGNIEVSVSSPSATREPAWGSIYWQYFEDLNKITPSGNGKIPIILSKKIFVEKNTDRGPVLEPVPDNGSFKIGDKIKVRIELRVDRNLEYVHMKDMHASCMEPVDVLSGWKWQSGLAYYETPKDASTNFFFSWLPKGTHVFEYTLFATTAGHFSNGITTIQCMYAPEFSAHSEGIRISVEERN